MTVSLLAGSVAFSASAFGCHLFYSKIQQPALRHVVAGTFAICMGASLSGIIASNFYIMYRVIFF